jgi:hypothetical protein
MRVILMQNFVGYEIKLHIAMAFVNFRVPVHYSMMSTVLIGNIPLISTLRK